MMPAPCLLPNFVGSDVFVATGLGGSFLGSPNPTFLAIATHPVYGISSSDVTSLGLRSHSDHGSLSDVVGTFGPACGYQVEHCQL
eukprot:5149931-Prymnesium_polylepis.1